jgi:hypothetical protein
VSGIAFGNAGRLWAVSEAGPGISTTIPCSICSNRFSRWSSRSTSRAWGESIMCRRQRSGGTERCYGAGDKDMATSSLHVTDGVPRCPSRTT